MPKVVTAFLWAKAGDALAEQRPERVDRSTARGPDDRFELGEAEFDRLEVVNGNRKLHTFGN